MEVPPRQGDVAFGEKRLMLASQDCELARGDFPVLACSVVELPPDDYGQAKRGARPHLVRLTDQQDSNVRFFADLRTIEQIDRKDVAQLHFGSDPRFDRDRIEIGRAIARFFSRFGIPEPDDKVLSGLLGQIKKSAVKNSSTARVLAMVSELRGPHPWPDESNLLVLYAVVTDVLPTAEELESDNFQPPSSPPERTTAVIANEIESETDLLTRFQLWMELAKSLEQLVTRRGGFRLEIASSANFTHAEMLETVELDLDYLSDPANQQ